MKKKAIIALVVLLCAATFVLPAGAFDYEYATPNFSYVHLLVDGNPALFIGFHGEIEGFDNQRLFTLRNGELIALQPTHDGDYSPWLTRVQSPNTSFQRRFAIDFRQWPPHQQFEFAVDVENATFTAIEVQTERIAEPRMAGGVLNAEIIYRLLTDPDFVPERPALAEDDFHVGTPWYTIGPMLFIAAFIVLLGIAVASILCSAVQKRRKPHASGNSLKWIFIFACIALIALPALLTAMLFFAQPSSSGLDDLKFATPHFAFARVTVDDTLLLFINADDEMVFTMHNGEVLTLQPSQNEDFSWWFERIHSEATSITSFYRRFPSSPFSRHRLFEIAVDADDLSYSIMEFQPEFIRPRLAAGESNEELIHRLLTEPNFRPEEPQSYGGIRGMNRFDWEVTILMGGVIGIIFLLGAVPTSLLFWLINRKRRKSHVPQDQNEVLDLR